VWKVDDPDERWLQRGGVSILVVDLVSDVTISSSVSVLRSFRILRFMQIFDVDKV
jgi:hypothetical protein